MSLTLAGLATVQANVQAQTSNLPQGGVAVHGSATMQQNGNTLNVNTTNGAGNRSIINWQSFNIGAGHTTNINQPNAQSSSLNRVVTNTPTQIYGTLRSNGQVILVNQNGIAVGAGGVVDTAGFTASTLNISDADYKAKRLRFEGNALSGGVLVEGEDRSDPNNIRPGALVRSSNGDVMLFAPNVTVGKDAKVKADNGNVIVGAGQSVEVTGRGLEGVRFVIQSADNKAINLGTLQGNAVGVFAGTLRHSGVIQAQTATMEGGRVVLRAIKDVEIVKDPSLATAPVISANGGVNGAGVAQKAAAFRLNRRKAM
ncbi:MAG: filamentous hemagglutinin N-terminal domain-containing protein [Brachymonas sp.]|nr:filamentous hemagglutinin N-terminal domain-containing protein [Brachymonas sp.]